MCYVDDQQAKHAEDEGHAEWLAEMADTTAEMSVKARIDAIADGDVILFHESHLLADLIASDELWQDLIATYFREFRKEWKGAIGQAFLDQYKDEVKRCKA